MIGCMLHQFMAMLAKGRRKLSYSNYTSSLVQTIPTPYAVLDLHFSPNNPMLAVATSAGLLCLFQVNECDSGPMRHMKTIELANPSILILALAWRPTPDEPATIATSLSDGRIAIVNIENAQSKDAVSHSLEAWTLCWSAYPLQTKQVYSGGDDSVICRHQSLIAIWILRNRLKILGERNISHSAAVPKSIQLVSQQSFLSLH